MSQCVAADAGLSRLSTPPAMPSCHTNLSPNALLSAADTPDRSPYDRYFAGLVPLDVGYAVQ